MLKRLYPPSLFFVALLCWHLAPSTLEAADPATPGTDWRAAREFWSFQPVRVTTMPAVRNESWCRTATDRFILARLEAEGLKPVGAADKRTLIRRAYFDLIGLPPTPEDIESFLTDDSPGAFATVIDRLLASSHYGERWGRYWLDVARYAEDQAHTFAVQPYTNAWRYRDWVIDAFNADMPYDLFVKRQIAADLMDDEAVDGGRHYAALGFFGLGAQYYKNTDAAKAAADELDDRVDTLARGFLGLTLACARCHDHKFDPIPTQDYYSIAGVFFNSKLAPVSLAPRSTAEQFQAAQKKAQDTEKALRDFIAAERLALATQNAERVAVYVTATWRLRGRQQQDPKVNAFDLAQQDALNATFLERMAKLLAPDSKVARNTPSLENWRKLPADATKLETLPEVKKAAEEFQAAVITMLAEQKKLPGSPFDAKNKNGEEKTRVELLQAVLGDGGVFGVTEDQLASDLPDDKKTRLAELRQQAETAKKSVPPAPAMAHGLQEAGTADIKVYVRGNPAQQGELAPRRFLRVLAGDEPSLFKRGSGRLELAEAVASKDNPLTARVIVNRVWQHHFGRGMVGTPSNFGRLGERPTHPELLDYLTSRFLDSGWSIKALHREIMLSAVYQLGTEREAGNLQKDPDNRLHWRMAPRRLDVEAYRDALLAVSGKLDQSTGGPTVDLNAAQNQRRTVYAKISRHELNGLLRLFDFPDANITSEARTETTVPQQQLFVLNSPFFIAQTRATAERIQKEEPDDAVRIRRAYVVLFGREAKDVELRIGQGYLNAVDDPAQAGKNQLTRWERYIQALLASNEFMYVD
jgi:hypothetical protein